MKAAAASIACANDALRMPEFYLLWLVPFGVYLFLALFYTNAFIAIPSVCVILSALGALAGFGMWLLRMRSPLWLPLAITTLTAVAVGTLFGLYAFDQYAVFPKFYSNSRMYTNVVPSQPSAAVADAGKIVFSSESTVDVSKSVGYITESGYTYCVAPVRDSSGTARIEFWAAGVGCCAKKGDFYCDSAADTAAHAGIVVFDNNGFFGKARKDYYEQARQKAEATFFLQSATAPMFVRWVREDKMDMLSNYYRSRSVAFLALLSVLYLGIAAGFAYVLAKPPKGEGLV